MGRTFLLALRRLLLPLRTARLLALGGLLLLLPFGRARLLTLRLLRLTFGLLLLALRRLLALRLTLLLPCLPLGLALLTLAIFGLLALTAFGLLLPRPLAFRLLTLARLRPAAISLRALLTFGALLLALGLLLLPLLTLRLALLPLCPLLLSRLLALRLLGALRPVALAIGLLLLPRLLALGLFLLTPFALRPLLLALSALLLTFGLLLLTPDLLVPTLRVLLAFRLPLIAPGALLQPLCALLLAFGLAILPQRHLLAIRAPVAHGRRTLALVLAALFGARDRALALGLGALADKAILADIATGGDLFQPRTAAFEAPLAPGIEALRLYLAKLALIAPMCLLAGRDAAVIALPVGLLRARLRPASAVIEHSIAPLRPTRSEHRAPVVPARCGVQPISPRIITRGVIAPCGPPADRNQPAIIVIDRNQPAIVIAVAVIGIAHQIRIFRSGRIVIAAIAVIDRLREIERIVIGLPRPGIAVVITIAVIGRCIAERPGQRQRLFDEAVTGPTVIGIALRRHAVIERLGIGQLVGGGGIAHRSRRTTRLRVRNQRQRLGERRKLREGGRLRGGLGVVRSGRYGLARPRGERERDRRGAGERKAKTGLGQHDGPLLAVSIDLPSRTGPVNPWWLRRSSPVGFQNLSRSP